MYCAAASRVEVMPRKAAQRETRRREEGPKVVKMRSSSEVVVPCGRGIGKTVSCGEGKALAGRLEMSRRVPSRMKTLAKW